MKKVMRTDNWLLAILLALLATSATAGLIVTDPVVNDPNEDLIVAGDAYDSITITSGPYYGMAALYTGIPVDIYIVVTDDPDFLGTLVTDITVTKGEGGGAYCMYVPTGTIYADGISGDLVATADSGAYGIYAQSVDIGLLSGTISATATIGQYAVGISAGDPDTVSIAAIDADAVISAFAEGGYAYGIYSSGNVNILGGIAGTISATTAGNYAYGIYSSDGNIVIGDISGSIDANAVGSVAYGIYADSDLTIDSITETGSIGANAGDSWAYGISAGNDISIGDISGDIGANADWSRAYGIIAGNDISIGDISGDIGANTGWDLAYGISAGNDISIGDISGSIGANAVDNRAAGISAGNSIEIGAITGSIFAEATTGDNAYGIYASGDVTIDSITETGSISATAGGDGAYGIYSGSINSVYIPGGIAGTITADANNYAYGIWSDGLVEIGGISGSIDANATDSGAYGIYASGDVTIDSIAETGSISATAGGDDAYGIYSQDGDISIGDITGNIVADANVGGAYGIYSDDGDISIGNISGNITATAGGDDAYGIRADYDIEIGDISGNITATAGNDDAYGISAYYDIEIGDITGTISAEATTGSNARAISADGDVQIDSIGEGALIEAYAALGEAYGIYAGDDIYIANDIDGDITATADDGSNAYGIYAYHNIEMDDISGDITATAYGDGAYGIFGTDDSERLGQYVEIDEISGDISASAGGDDAYGITSWYGSLDTGDISGNITATAGGSDAYGLYAYESELDIDDLTGTISATAGSEAYAIYADYSDFYADAIDGTVYAYADGDGAYGIYAGTDGDIGGDIDIDSIDYDGYIDVYAGGDDAYGIYGDGDIAIGYIDGDIDTEADGSNAHGIYGGGDITIGDITGYIEAYADGSNVYGVDAGGSVYTGDITGTISAYTYGYDAYGISADANVAISSVSDYGSIAATAEDGYDAYGISAGGDVTIGSIIAYGYNEAISAYAGYNNAYGISADGDVAIDSIYSYGYGYDEAITAYAENDNAYGIYADGDVDIDSISNYYGYGHAISAYAGYDNAYGIYAGGDVTIGSISDSYGYGSYSSIDAYAGDDNAYGIYAEGDVSIDSISGYGSIEASTGYYNAYGIYAGGDVTIGGIGANSYIDAWADEEGAYGIYSEGSTDTGTIAGDVYAGADYDYAMAIHAGGTLDTTVTGRVEAEAYDGDQAIALSAYDAMNIRVNGGDVIGRYDDGEDWQPAWAIRSGEYGMGWMDQPVDDTVEITSGSYIYGDIDLGSYDGDNDYLGLYAGSGEPYDYPNITGDMANIEWIEIYGGTWYVLGDAYNNVYGINMYDGVLNWQGTVEDLAIDGGTFSPGNSIGTTTVTADFMLGEDTTFVVEVDDDENADLVDVSGTAYLEGGTIQPVPDEEYFITHPFQATVISAEGGFAEGYDEFVEEWTPFFDYEVIYDTSDPCDSLVVLDIDRAGFNADTKNERAVAGALDHIIAGGDMDQETQDVLVEIRTLQHEAEDGNPRLLDELTPQDAMGLAQVTGATMLAFNDSMFDRVGNVLTGRPFAMAGFGQPLVASAYGTYSAKSTSEEWRPFIKGIGSWGDQDGEKGISGYTYNFYGMTAGADKIVNDNWLFGVSFGGTMANVDYDKARTDADIDTAMVALYGSYFKDNWHIDFTLGYGHNWYDSERSIEIGEDTWKASSDHDGNMYSVALQAGMNLGDETTIIEPIIGGGYTSISEDGYTEEGADPLNLKVDSHTTDAFYGKVGIRLAAQMKGQDNTVLVPEVGAFWIHDFSDAAELDSEFGDGSAFTVEGLEPDDSINVTAGLNAYFSDWRLFVNYGWQTSSDLNSHTVKGGIQWDF